LPTAFSRIAWERRLVLRVDFSGVIRSGDSFELAVHVRIDAGWGKRLSAMPIVRPPKHTLSYLVIGLIFDRARQALLLFPRSIHVAFGDP
jgi:hypothetical protein